HADDHHGDLGPGGGRLAQRARAMTRNLAAVQQTVDAGQQLDEHAEFRRAHRAAVHDLPLAQPRRHGGPGIALERLQAERDLALRLVEAEDFHGDLLADTESITRALHARVREL